MQFDDHVEGSGQGKDVIRLNDVGITTGSVNSQVKSSRASKGCFGRSPGVAAALNHVQNPRFGCNEGPQVCWAGNVPRRLVRNTWLASAKSGLFQTVLCKSWKVSLDLCQTSMILEASFYWRIV